MEFGATAGRGRTGKRIAVQPNQVDDGEAARRERVANQRAAIKASREAMVKGQAPAADYEIANNITCYREGTSQVFEGHQRQDGCVQVEILCTEERPFFEVKVISTGIGGQGAISVGFGEKDHPLNVLPGLAPNSVGYHFDKGQLLTGRGEPPLKSAQGLRVGDTIRCGIRTVGNQISLHWQLNNHRLIKYMLPAGRENSLYPVVGLRGKASVSVTRLLDPDADVSHEVEAFDEPEQKGDVGADSRRAKAKIESMADFSNDAPLPVAPTRSKLGNLDKVFMEKYQMQTEQGAVFEWRIVNQRNNTLEFTVDFTGTENFDLGGPTVQKTIIKDFETKRVAKIVQRDVYQAARIGLKYGLKVLEPSIEDVKQQAEEARAGVRDALAQTKAAGIRPGMKVADIVRTVKQRKIQFIDPQFPPGPESISPNEKEANAVPIEWRSPRQWIKGAQENIIFDGIDPLDISQGRLGNCWFCCAMSALAEHEELVTKIFHGDRSPAEVQEAANLGIFQLSFCKNGKWQEIILDEFFPCYPGQGPIYTKNRGNELWVALLEKAYAKLHGSYAALKSGNPSDALGDLTGYPTDYYSLESDSVKAMVQDGSFWSLLLLLGQQDQLMTAGTPGQDKFTELGINPNNAAGIVAGHAYTMLDVREHRDRRNRVTRLIKLRNPWGKFEWTGDWSDSSPLWTPELRSHFHCDALAADDGAFFMSFEDFLKNFISVNVCYRMSKAGKPWFDNRVDGTFRYDPSQKHCVSTDAFYTVSVDERRCNFFFCVHQIDKRQPGAPEYIDFGVIVTDDRGRVVADSGLEMERENQVSVELDPGVYTVFPYSSGAKMAALRVRDRAYTMTIHADDESSCQLTPVAVDLELLNLARRADILSEASRATKKSLAPGLDVYTYWNGSVWSLGLDITNQCKANGAELTIDCSKSRNMVSSRGAMVHKARVKKGEFYIFHNLAMDDPTQDSSASYSMTGQQF